MRKKQRYFAYAQYDKKILGFAVLLWVLFGNFGSEARLEVCELSKFPKSLK